VSREVGLDGITLSVVGVGHVQPSLVLVKGVVGIGAVVQAAVLFIEVPLLSGVILDVLLEVGPLARPPSSPVVILGRQNQVEGGVLGLSQMKVEASIRLHRGSLGLSVGLGVGSHWRDVAVHNLDVKINIGSLRHGIIAEGSDNLRSSIDQG